MSASERQSDGHGRQTPRTTKLVKGPALTLLCLLAILAANVAAAFIDFGGYQLVLNVVLAVASVLLIAFFFMQLRREPSLNRLAAVAGLLWLVLFFMLIFSDYFTRVTHPF